MPCTPSAICKPDKDIPGKENKARVPGEQTQACPAAGGTWGRGAEARYPDCGDGCRALIPGCAPPAQAAACGRITRRLFPFQVKIHPDSSQKGGHRHRLSFHRGLTSEPGGCLCASELRGLPPHPQPGSGSPRAEHPDATPLLTELVTQRPPDRDKPPSTQASEGHQARARRAWGHSVHPGSLGKVLQVGVSSSLPLRELKSKGEDATVSRIEELIKSAGLTDPVSEPGRGAEN